MILVDTSIWIEHLRAGEEHLVRLLDGGSVLVHPFVIGEIALGTLHQRSTVLEALAGLPQTVVATDTEVLHLIDRNGLFGRGIGYVDAHLLASVHLTPGTEMWTNDKRLHAVATELSVAFTARQ